MKCLLACAVSFLLIASSSAAEIDLLGFVQSSNNPGITGYTFAASMDYDPSVLAGASTGLATFTNALESLSINGGASTSFSGAPQNVINYTRGGSPVGDHVGLNIAVGGDLYALDLVFAPGTLGSSPYSLADLSTLTTGHFTSGTFTASISGLTATGSITSFSAPTPSAVPEPASPLMLALALAASFFTVKGKRALGLR